MSFANNEAEQSAESGQIYRLSHRAGCSKAKRQAAHFQRMKMTFVFDLLYFIAAILISPVLLYRMVRHKRYRAGWANRFGKICRKSPDKKSIWIHAVSLGEINAVKTLVNELDKLPGFEIVISSTTDTGFTRAKELYGSKFTVIYFPFDLSFIMKRAFANLNPAICILVELEIWPNLVGIANRKNIPVVVVNGRIGNKSYPKYRAFRPVVKKIFQGITLTLAQSPEYAQRFIQLGAKADRVIVAGSLKYDTAQIADKVEGADRLAEGLNIRKDQRLFVAGGTGDGEEKIILEVYKKIVSQEKFRDLRLAVIPRKPERFDEVDNLIRQGSFESIRYSKIKNKTLNVANQSSINAVILGDTMGDLRKFYSLASLIFVGRSLVPMGGSDMAEAAALGKCTIFGPYTFNFNQTARDLLEDKGAIQVKNNLELSEAIEKCLDEPGYAREIARSGQNVIRKNQGATKKTAGEIKAILAGQASSIRV
jgi:3-deoxy-D-manno-octulosonic-acid transferase